MLQLPWVWPLSSAALALLTHAHSLSAIEDACVLAVDEEYVDMDAKVALHDKAQLAVIPPINGG